MDKYESVSTIKINNNQYMVHKNFLKNTPFFEDFLKNSNEVINIQVDEDITPEIVNLLIDNLYGNKIKLSSIDNLNLFLLFRLADYLCLDINFVTEYSCYWLQDAYNYAYEKKLIDDFIKFIDYFEFDISIKSFTDHMDFDIVTKIKRNYGIFEINELFDNNLIDFVIEILKKNLFINIKSMNYLKTFFDNVIEHLDKKDNIEHTKIIIDFIVNNKDIRRKFSSYKYGNKYDKEELKIKLYQDYCDEKVEKEI